MNNQEHYREFHGLRIWELALLLALCVTLLTGLWAQGRQRTLADKLIRLHVVAASDDPADQATKLAVRDELLAQLEPALRETESAAQAEAVMAALLPELTAAAAAVSGQTATVTLTNESFPTREYDSFSLPAGDYRALRVTLGAGEGQNWWCVMFPPLCLDAAAVGATETAEFTDDDWRLVSEDGDGYVLRFRILELWGELQERFNRGVTSPAQ